MRFEKTIVNHGRIAIPYAWGHHPAFGPPLLAEGSRFDLPRLEPGCRQDFELQAGFCPGGVRFEGEFLSIAL